MNSIDKKKRFDAVLFDLDDTLFNSTLMSSSARRNAIRAICEAGVKLNDEEEAYNLLMKIVNEYGSNYNEHFNRFIEKLGYEVHPKLIAAAIVAYHQTKNSLLRPFPGVILTLLELMKSMKIGIISDGLKIKQWEKLTYLGIQHFFDVVIINDLPLRWKPSEIGYKEAMTKLNLDDSSRIAFVGNKIETDIFGANKMGMISVLFNPTKEIKVENLDDDKKPKHVIKHFGELIEIIGLKSIRWKF
ncbi:MAG: TIGR02253 family HAD-type hydrolase [Candidatus Heimdallarchaeota archaeon]|nr:TIGR02253 family HAD-type hydrolase [Candidatus Heimdallarchaeota archaeon]